MSRARSVLGYSAAALTLVAAVLTPFLLLDVFQRGVAGLGLRVDPVYGGGDEVRSLTRGGYRIVVHEVVRPGGLWPRGEPFVQVAWTPVSALPPRVSDEIDVDGDGRVDALVTFDVPADPAAPLAVEVAARSPLVRAVPAGGGAGESCASLILRVGDRIVVRLPIERPPAVPVT